MQHLDLRDNNFRVSLPIDAVPSATSRLECLVLDLHSAVHLLDVLRSLTALRRLALNSTCPPVTEAEVLALLDVVGRLPQLQTLKVLIHHKTGKFAHSVAMRTACESLAAQHPCLRFMLVECDDYIHLWKD